MNRRELAKRTGIAALAALGSTTIVRAQGRGARSLEGVWDVTITAHPGAPPFAAAPSRRFITYAMGGTVFDHSGVANEMPAQGVWEHAGQDRFEGTWIRLIRDAQGQITSANKVRSRIQVISDNEYVNEAKVEILDPGGNVLFSWTAEGRGRRITLEPFA